MFILRSAHDAILAAKDAELSAARELAATYKALLDAATRKPDPLPKREPDPIAVAIGDVARNDNALRTHLAHFAKVERTKGTDPKDIERQIRDWTWRPDTAGDRAKAESVLAEMLDD